MALTSKEAREQLEGTIGDLVRERDTLLGAITSAAEREHAARVDALTANPSKRSDAAGAASRPYKIAEQARRDEERLSGIERELNAARVALSKLDEQAAEEARAGRVRASRALRKREEAALDALRETAAQFAERFVAYAALVHERADTIGHSGDDLELAPAIPVQETASALFNWLEREKAKREPAEPGSFPAPAPAGAVVPVRRGEAGWRQTSAVTR